MGLNLTSSPHHLKGEGEEVGGKASGPGAVSSGPYPPRVVSGIPLSRRKTPRLREPLPRVTSWPLAPAVSGRLPEGEGWERQAVGGWWGPSQTKSCPSPPSHRWASQGPPVRRSLTPSCPALPPPPTMPRLMPSLDPRTRTCCPPRPWLQLSFCCSSCSRPGWYGTGPSEALLANVGSPAGGVGIPGLGVAPALPQATPWAKPCGQPLSPRPWQPQWDPRRPPAPPHWRAGTPMSPRLRSRTPLSEPHTWGRPRKVG